MEGVVSLGNNWVQGRGWTLWPGGHEGLGAQPGNRDSDRNGVTINASRLGLLLSGYLVTTKREVIHHIKSM